jgi:Protein of unknown function (DUF2510)
VPFFGRGAGEQERSVRSTRTVTGNRMTEPEEIGTLPRRARLMAAAVRRVRPHPLAQPNASGRPFGDGSGMEDVVAVIRPLFSTERSITRWVAIRGALLFLDMATTDNKVAWFDIITAMGMEVVRDPATGELRPTVTNPDGLTPTVVGNVIGVCASLKQRLDDYDQVSKMPIDDVNADPTWAIVNEAIALDYIAWTSVALCRTNLLQDTVQRMPDPGLLETPGWYADPLWAKAERFWDGGDWTARMRVQDGRRWIETSQPLR